ncbi:DUF2493 domain-containing protein [Candidatus Fermentibacteria bacterium]|nr:DUF2493 domain-containing protein [Candidatus Fermentibacteria bacterium]
MSCCPLGKAAQLRTIIAGSRSVDNIRAVEEAVTRSGFSVSEVVSGCARGADRLGEMYAGKNGLPVKRFPADWRRLGRMAGVVRNHAMARYADALIAVWDGRSRGTGHMITTARKRGLRVYIYLVGEDGVG